MHKHRMQLTTYSKSGRKGRFSRAMDDETMLALVHAQETVATLAERVKDARRARAQLVREAVEHRGYSYQRVAEALGCNPSSVGKMLALASEPDREPEPVEEPDHPDQIPF